MRDHIVPAGIIWLLLLGLIVQPGLALVRVGGGLLLAQPPEPFVRLSLDLLLLGFDLDYLPQMGELPWLVPCLKLRLPLLLVTPYIGIAPILQLEPAGPTLLSTMALLKAGSELALPSGAFFAELQLWASLPQFQIGQPGLALGILVGF